MLQKKSVNTGQIVVENGTRKLADPPESGILKKPGSNTSQHIAVTQTVTVVDEPKVTQFSRSSAPSANTPAIPTNAEVLGAVIVERKMSADDNDDVSFIRQIFFYNSFSSNSIVLPFLALIQHCPP